MKNPNTENTWFVTSKPGVTWKEIRVD